MPLLNSVRGLGFGAENRSAVGWRGLDQPSLKESERDRARESKRERARAKESERERGTDRKGGGCVSVCVGERESCGVGG